VGVGWVRCALPEFSSSSVVTNVVSPVWYVDQKMKSGQTTPVLSERAGMANVKRYAVAYLVMALVAQMLAIGAANPAAAQTFSEGEDYRFDYLLGTDGNGDPITVDWQLFGGAVELPYWVHEDVVSAGYLDSVHSAFQTWEDAPGSLVSFSFQGVTSVLSEATFANFTWGQPSDGINVVSFGPTAPGIAGRGGLNGDQITIDPVTGLAGNGSGHFDVTIDESGVFAVGAVAGRLDIESLLLHEIGHTLGLGHPTNRPQSIMHSELSGNEIQRSLGAADVYALSLLYPDPGTLASFNPAQPGHSMASNAAGYSVFTLLKEDGQLFTIRQSPNGSFGNWIELGRGNWASANVAIDENGRAEIVAVKATGALHTRSWLLNGTFGPWTRHGASTWATDSSPSVGTSGSNITIAAIKEDGRLYTRQRSTSGGWAGFKKHGKAGWAQLDVAVADDGDLWYAATKNDGRLFVRKQINGNWSGFAKQGKATWATDMRPSISARSSGVVYAALKADGTLYTRSNNGSWSGFLKQGSSNWVSASVDTNEAGAIVLGAVKDTGLLYTRTKSGSWNSFSLQSGQFSIEADPSVALAGSSASYVAVRPTGQMVNRVGSGSSRTLGASNWAN